MNNPLVARSKLERQHKQLSQLWRYLLLMADSDEQRNVINTHCKALHTAILNERLRLVTGDSMIN